MFSKKSHIRGAFLTGLILLVAAAVLTSAGKGSLRTQAQGNTDSDQEIKKVLREQGLRGVARLKGHYVGTNNSHWFSMFTLETLTKHSAFVVIGTPQHNRCNISDEGDDITTDYQVALNETIKGKHDQTGMITVSLPGGRVEFEDGTSAEIRVPGFRKMVNGETYALFLTETTPGSGIYTPVGGAQGIFEISTRDMKVKPHGEPGDRVTKENKDKDLGSFLKEARKAAKKWPEPGSCCQ